MFFDIRKEKEEIESISFNSRKGFTSNYSIANAVGVRALVNGNWGLVGDTKFKKDMVKEAEKIARLGNGKIKVKRKKINETHKIKNKNIELMKYVKEIVDGLNGKIKNVSISKTFVKKEYEDSYGRKTKQDLFYLDLSIQEINLRNGMPVIAYNRFSWTKPEMPNVEDLIKRTNKQLNELMKAKLAKPGKFDLILDPDLAGVFFHEAVGHATEADAVLENSSVFKNKIGKVVANEDVSMYDDPTIFPEHGYYVFDDEGTKGRRKALIKRGVLKNYLHSLTTASLMNVKPNGNGRSQSPFNFPIPRMSNITIDKGDLKFDEMVESVKEGFLGIGSFGGETDPSTGNFMFNAKYGYYIKNGEIKHPVLNVSFGGNILKILKKVKIGNKLIPTYVGGFCGKAGQIVPVSERMPYIMVKGATVGGR